MPIPDKFKQSKDFNALNDAPHRHAVAPKDWQKTPDISGSPELDAVIARELPRNRNLKDRLDMYTDPSQVAYGPLTGYNGYHNYSGDS